MSPEDLRKLSRITLVSSLVLGLTLGTSANPPRVAGVPPPAPIPGGTFEASAVAYVPGSRGVLFVDDGRSREILWMELTSAGRQPRPAERVPLGADVTDLEGMTRDGRYFYVVGSQSKRFGFDGDGLVRFTFDAEQRRIENVETIRNLKAFLAAHVAELKGTASRLGDEVLNIEGLAWDPKRHRLLLGLRAPVVDGQALVVPLIVPDHPASFTTANLRVDGGGAVRVPLGGAGIRSLEYNAASDRFDLIAGAAMNAEKLDFRLVPK